MRGLNALKSPIAALFIVFIVETVAAVAFYHYNQTNISEIITSYFTVILATSTVFYVILTMRLVSETRQYVRLTDQLVSETRKTREVLTDPKISVEAKPKFKQPSNYNRQAVISLESSKYLHIQHVDLIKEPRIEFELIFRNIGSGAAYDITPKILDINIKNIDVDKPNQSSKSKLKSSDDLEDLISELFAKLSEVRAFESGIDYIAPNDKKLFFFWTVNVTPYNMLAEHLVNYTVKIKIDYHKYPEEMREGVKKPFTDTYSIYFSDLVESIFRTITVGDQQ